MIILNNMADEPTAEKKAVAKRPPTNKKTQIKKKQPKIGRPQVISEEMTEKVVKSIGVGMPIKSACAIAGIGDSTYYKYMSIGRQFDGWEKDDIPEDMLPFAEFTDTVKRAIATSKLKLLNDINQDPDWRAKAWILERRFPDEFGRRDRVIIEERHIKEKVQELSLEDIEAEIIELEKELENE